MLSRPYQDFGTWCVWFNKSGELYNRVTPATQRTWPRKNSLLSSDLLIGVVGVSFISEDLCDELTSMGHDHLMRWILYFFLLFYLIKLPVWKMHFVTFPCILRVFFFAMRMKLWEGAWGKDVPSFDGKRRPLGHNWLLSFPIQKGRVP